MSSSIKRLLAGALLSFCLGLFAACGDMTSADANADLDEEGENIPAVHATSNKKVQAPPAKSPRRPVERLQADDTQQNVLPEPKLP